MFCLVIECGSRCGRIFGRFVCAYEGVLRAAFVVKQAVGDGILAVRCGVRM